MAGYRLRINGVERTLESSDPDQPLLYGLRGLGLTATKFGCGLGQCGTFSVLLDGRPTRSCLETIANAQGKSVCPKSSRSSLVLKIVSVRVPTSCHTACTADVGKPRRSAICWHVDWMAASSAG